MYMPRRPKGEKNEPTENPQPTYPQANGIETNIKLSLEKIPIGGVAFTMVYPADIDATIDMYIGEFGSF